MPKDGMHILENANKKDYIEKYARSLEKCGVALAW